MSWDNSGIFVEVRFGPFRLHPIEGLTRGARELHVTPKSLSVLCFLASHPGKVVAKDDLVRAVWRDIAVSDSALTSCIKELRRALKDNAKQPRFIETLNRRGYRFIAELLPPAASPPERASRRGRGSTGSLVGREDALAEMSAALGRAANGERQILFVAGEPGIGKTAVVDAFMRELEQVGSWRLTHGQCVEHYGESEPYQPLLDALSRLCRHTAADAFVPILRRYAPSWLAQLPALQTPSEARLLTRRTSGVTSERMQRELMEALECMASDTPIILWLEDVHWSDLATLDWMAAFAARTDGARLLLIATYRTADVRAGRHPLPAIVDDLRVKARCEEIVLAGLTQSDVCAYLAARFPAGSGALDRLGMLVHRHTEGNPLFVVNVLRDLVARRVLTQTDGRWIADPDVDASSFGVPEDVRRTITRQVDRLNPAERAMLETMSVLGRTGAAAAVAAGGDVATTDVEAALGALARERWFVRERPPAEWPDGTVSASFEFLHALYREVLESRVHPARRVELHRKIGERLENGYGARAAEIAAELAVHFEQARDTSRAVTHLQRAAETSRRRSAYLIAEQQLRRALALLAELPSSAERAMREIELRIALGSLLMAVRGWGFDEIETHYQRALELCRDQDSPRLFPSLWGLWLFRWGRGDGPAARDLAATLRGHAERSLDSAQVLQACHASWATSFSLGHLDDARRQATEGHALYSIEPHAALASAYGNHDAGVCAMNFKARALVLLGAVDEAVSVSEAAVALARELEHPFTLAQTLFFASTVHHARRDAQATLALASAGAAMAREQGFRLFFAWSSILEGWAFVQIGRRDEGLALLRDALRTADAGSRQFMTHFHGVFAEACLSGGRHEEGLHSAEEGLRLAAHGEERFYESELFRLRGELRLAAGGMEAAGAAEEDFRRAVAVAASQGAQWLGLRAATSLGRLAALTRDERNQLLVDAMHRVNEGTDLLDMCDARDLLRRLEP